MSQAATKLQMSPRKELIKLFQQVGYRNSTWKVFSDFVELAALSISNSVDWAQKEKRQAQYMEIMSRYEQKERELFPIMLARLVDALDDEITMGGPRDVLGEIFHELELHNKWTGQFFTPGNVCEMMGSMACGDEIQEKVRNKGYITLNEPACGSGAMVIGFCKAMKDRGLNYCSQVVVTAQDIDFKCVAMTYLQLSLYGVPAVVIHGNTLTVDEWSRWYTPIYVLNGWQRRQRCGMTDRPDPVTEAMKRIEDPVYGEVRDVEKLIAASVDHGETRPTAYSQLSLFE